MSADTTMAVPLPPRNSTGAARGSVFWPSSLNEKMATLPYYIYQYSQSPYPTEQRLAWGGAVVLLVFVVLLNVGIRVMAGRRGVAAARAD